MALHKQVPINNASALGTPQMVARRCPSAASPGCSVPRSTAVGSGASAVPQPVPCPVLLGGTGGTGGGQAFPSSASSALRPRIPKGILQNVTASGFADEVGICVTWAFSAPGQAGPIEKKTRRSEHAGTLARSPGRLAKHSAFSALNRCWEAVCGTMLP